MAAQKQVVLGKGAVVCTTWLGACSTPRQVRIAGAQTFKPWLRATQNARPRSPLVGKLTFRHRAASHRGIGRSLLGRRRRRHISELVDIHRLCLARQLARAHHPHRQFLVGCIVQLRHVLVVAEVNRVRTTNEWSKRACFCRGARAGSPACPARKRLRMYQEPKRFVAWL